MKKLIYSILTLAVVAMATSACGGDTYEKRLKKERRAIERFLADEEIEVIRDYPDNHKFGEKQYYLEGSTGVYLRVIDPGDTDGALGKDEIKKVYVRFDSVYQLVKKTKIPGNDVSNGEPMEFTYGNNNTYLSSSDDIHGYFMSPACVLPLEKGVGNGAIVSLIVPFVNGSSYQISSYEPYYYSKLSYTYRRHTGGEEDEKDSAQ